MSLHQQVNGPPRGQGDGGEILVVGCGLWGALGMVIALAALPKVNADARVVVGILSVVLPGLAIAAGFLAWRGKRVLAALALLVSVFTPTYYLYVVNLIPIGLAVAILLQARAIRRRRSGQGALR